MKFTKMQGIGNDFIIMEHDELNGMSEKELAVKLCDRHFGIGADGLILVCDSTAQDVRMEIINSDGSEAQMCGNGIRCFTKYVFERGIVKKKKMNIETLAGVIISEVFLDNEGKVNKVRADMGAPVLEREKIPVRGSGTFINQRLPILGKIFYISAVNTGVPHAVIFIDDIDNFDVTAYGQAIEKNENFPAGTNADFVKAIGKDELKMKTWERGAGLTLACGSGACAAAYISYIIGLTNNRVNVNLPGGKLFIEIEDNICMTGPCEKVFAGDVNV